MKASDLRTKSTSDLAKELHASRREVLNLNVQRGLGSAPKFHLFKQAKKNIARILTILNERGRI